jgi:hypothetical protein
MRLLRSHGVSCGLALAHSRFHISRRPRNFPCALSGPSFGISTACRRENSLDHFLVNMGLGTNTIHLWQMPLAEDEVKNEAGLLRPCDVT